MAVLLLAEMNGTELSLDATAKAVTAAKSLGDVTVEQHLQLHKLRAFLRFYVQMMMLTAMVWPNQ